MSKVIELSDLVGYEEQQETYKPALVIWLDSTAQSGWHDGNEVEVFLEAEPLRIQSLGWMVGQKDNWVVLAMSVCESKVGELLKIPRSVVESVKIL